MMPDSELCGVGLFYGDGWFADLGDWLCVKTEPVLLECMAVAGILRIHQKILQIQIVGHLSRQKI